ncbi:hypothetical protein GMST_07670 [Geomonas silvestris]|uniref:Uncharacterized protein n=1 Tax=Geomonas silvestris TaxID=2740184 RepID=A0A6V8MET9_9BACT|nr:hypothetical protein GMST_07670 [Geomonas silvestris]
MRLSRRGMASYFGFPLTLALGEGESAESRMRSKPKGTGTWRNQSPGTSRNHEPPGAVIDAIFFS